MIIRIRENRTSPKVSIEPNSVSSEAPDLRRRMVRIATHFQQLDELLDEVENKIQSDERLKAIDDSIQEVELTIDGRRRRWRPRKRCQKKSAPPRKPR
jgi:uncharacterized protein Yka (UPF0111/DUF47 family)